MHGELWFNKGWMTVEIKLSLSWIYGDMYLNYWNTLTIQYQTLTASLWMQFCRSKWDLLMSIVYWKTAVSPLLMHWSYCTLALSYQYILKSVLLSPIILMYSNCLRNVLMYLLQMWNMIMNNSIYMNKYYIWWIHCFPRLISNIWWSNICCFP